MRHPPRQRTHCIYGMPAIVVPQPRRRIDPAALTTALFVAATLAGALLSLFGQ